MSAEGSRIVLDCTVFARALINPHGPAGACVSYIQRGKITLIISDYVLQEVRELPGKIKPARGVTIERIEALLQDLALNIEFWSDVPNVFTHPIDADDSHYVDLAAASKASQILSNDKHLLILRDTATPLGGAFKARFPDLNITTPEEFMRVMARRTEFSSGD